MIREIFNYIKNEYRKTSQHIESLKRQMEENPEKFKQFLQDQKDTETEADKKKEEAKKEDEVKDEAQDEEAKEGEDGMPSRLSARSKKSAQVKEKRPPTDK